MPFKINFDASNFVSSIVSDAKSAVKGAIGDTINQKLGSLGPLGKLAATFINQTGGFNSGGPNNRTISRAIISSNNSVSDASDWRVSISVPDVLLDQGDILAPLRESSGSSAFNTGNRMIFPFNPTVLLSHSANYSQIQPTHTNYPYNAYENSQVDAITITGEFFNKSFFSCFAQLIYSVFMFNYINNI